jgi:hypothetical protein
MKWKTAHAIRRTIANQQKSTATGEPLSAARMLVENGKPGSRGQRSGVRNKSV